MLTWDLFLIGGDFYKINAVFLMFNEFHRTQTALYLHLFSRKLFLIFNTYFDSVYMYVVCVYVWRGVCMCVGSGCVYMCVGCVYV